MEDQKQIDADDEERQGWWDGPPYEPHRPNRMRSPHTRIEPAIEPIFRVVRTWPDGEETEVTSRNELIEALDVLSVRASQMDRDRHDWDWGITPAPMLLVRGLTRVYLRDEERDGKLFEVHDVTLDVDGGVLTVPIGKLTGRRPMTLISKETLMAMLELDSRTTIDNYADRYPNFPRKIKIDRGTVRYRLDEAEAFVAWLIEHKSEKRK